jgi:hypothetical protein
MTMAAPRSDRRSPAAAVRAPLPGTGGAAGGPAQPVPRRPFG